jgi:large subunit ribosomal protein L6
VERFYVKFGKEILMSNIGKKPIIIPDGVNVDITENSVNVKGKSSELYLKYNSIIQIAIKDNVVSVSRSSDDRNERSLHGLYRALINNMIQGVTEGFTKELNFVGVGYGVEQKGNFLLINAGFSHPVYVQIPDGINVELPKNTTLIIKGANKQNVGDLAAKIREIRKPEPYKGKGIKYSDEIIRRKAGKTVGATAGA